MAKFKKGKAFVREKTGSATMISLDGKSQPGIEADNSAVLKQLPSDKEPKE